MKRGEGQAWEFHCPVLAQELLELMNLTPGMVLCDATVGGGGLAYAMLEKVKGEAKLIGIDRDPEAIAFAGKKLEKFGSAVNLVKGRFSQLGNILDQLGIGKVDGIVFDLGVSSHQLENAERGFSFLRDGPLDLRMDQSQGEPASEVLARLNEKELERIFREYGEERYSRRVARAIVRKQEQGMKFTRTLELAGLVEAQIGRRGQRVHPATRIFQALRIYLNDEIEELRLGLKEALERLVSGGRLGVISYHSLEDREVKQFFRARERAGELKIITRKPLTPSREEIRLNPRSRSAKLRVAERN